MRIRQISVVVGILALGAALAGMTRAGAAAEDAKQPLPVQLTFDRPLDAAMTPFVVASSRGLFAAERLSVATNVAQGSTEAIERVGSGASDFALVDINELVRFRDKADAPPVKAVFVLFNAAPYAIVARRSRGIRALGDLDGKTLGVADSDLSIRFWPALARQNGIKAAGVKIYRISAAVREPILSAGQVDAVAGFSYLSAVNLRDRGIPADDLEVLRYADYGCEAYGFALIVNPAFAAGKPEAVRGLLRAVISASHLAIKDPGRAVDELVNRMESGSRELELARWRTVVAENILTAEVKRNGIGGLDPARFDRSIDQIAEDFKFRRKPAAPDIFDDGFLPPVGGRLIN
jgi:NitT/TauT family transport system substrate-binding protein